ncbi:hypothetical protein KNP414_04598 [Paenibacillus mucilaginosus KNP414]|uniref:Uncharacterized protein n=1 Tax=Paenibacillus mucilaginosus (strain KNP414) TaxID=1036673 RepID=F8FBS7_PAEMK|nr:hypothetical protein KNP414_04598 [Paenibacillus mucilaginosus KNP414]
MYLITNEIDYNLTLVEKNRNDGPTLLHLQHYIGKILKTFCIRHGYCAWLYVMHG